MQNLVQLINEPGDQYVESNGVRLPSRRMTSLCSATAAMDGQELDQRSCYDCSFVSQAPICVSCLDMESLRDAEVEFLLDTIENTPNATMADAKPRDAPDKVAFDREPPSLRMRGRQDSNESTDSDGSDVSSSRVCRDCYARHNARRDLPAKRRNCAVDLQASTESDIAKTPVTLGAALVSS
jgi:hypothetical protein